MALVLYMTLATLAVPIYAASCVVGAIARVIHAGLAGGYQSWQVSLDYINASRDEDNRRKET